jgi:adenylate cyclase
MNPQRVPRWLLLAVLISFGVNLLAVTTTGLTIGLMGDVSDFAREVQSYTAPFAQGYRMVAFVGASAAMLWYLWPVIAHFRCAAGDPPTALVARRSIGGPLVVAAIGFAPYLFSTVFFPALTLIRFGRWSTDLMSQQVLSSLVNGFLAATTTYLVLDWLFRTMVVPRVVPSGAAIAVEGAFTLGVRARLLVFLLAVAFTPLFTVLGLVRAAARRVDAGVAAQSVVATLTTASQVTFLVYLALGTALTLLLARSLTRPLAEMASALRRVHAGDLAIGLQVTSNDEVGVLASGVNELVCELRERERILSTFGRIVEPAVRDHLLAGEIQLGGEVRSAAVLFCDLRGFTGMSERMSPHDVVITLNGFFSAMTTWVRDCGGFVDKFIGDAMLVVFGLFAGDDAGSRAVAAHAALRCALGMQDRLAELNTSRIAAQAPPLRVSIGVHIGEVLAGTIGARDRHEYTVIGDTVNVAARLQQLCKSGGHLLLTSEVAYQLALSAGFAAELDEIDAVQLRGRVEPVRVYGVAASA